MVGRLLSCIFSFMLRYGMIHLGFFELANKGVKEMLDIVEKDINCWIII